MVKKKKYVELHISANALVPKGAVGVESVFKADGNFVKKVPVLKFNDEKMEMYTILYKLNGEDSQGYICDDPKVLAKAREEFVQNGGMKEVKLLHDGINLDGKALTCELWTVKQEVMKAGEELDGEMLKENTILRDPVFPDEEYIGALAVCTKFYDEGLWNKVKLEKWETSIEGKAKFVEFENEEEEITEKQTGFIAKIVKSIIGDGYVKLSKEVQAKLSKDFIEMLENDKNDLWKYIDLLWYALWDIQYSTKSNNVDDPAKLVKESIAQFQAQILESTDIFKKPETVKKGDDDMTKEELVVFLKSDEGKGVLKEVLGEEVINKADSETQIQTVVAKMVEDGKITANVNEDVLAKINKTSEDLEAMSPKVDEMLKTLNDDDEAIADPKLNKHANRKPFSIESSI